LLARERFESARDINPYYRAISPKPEAYGLRLMAGQPTP
jgi:hypothetical protein